MAKKKHTSEKGKSDSKADNLTEEVLDGAESTNEELQSDEELSIAEEAMDLDPLAAKEQEIAELKDKHLRLYAEFENFKKRKAKEKQDILIHAAERTLTSILPVLDDFDRSKQNEEEQWTEGVKLVYTKLLNTLKQQGLEIMETEDVDFDPEQHAAISEIPVNEEDKKGKVFDTVEKGYLLNEKIIRHAKVVVGK